jgi:PIN domain nuclease of toxin-antitoxin system
VRLLLDTHSFLWFVGGDSSLSVAARLLIEDADNSVLLSAASVWEIAIKVSLGKLHLEQPFDVLIPQQLLVNHIELLGITLQHTAIVARLPFHHRDPFDRLLIAQAIVEQIPVITRDPAFDAYPVQRLW